MSNNDVLSHPNGPWNQVFRGAGRKNLTKKNSWWAKSPFHNNGTPKKAKHDA